MDLLIRSQKMLASDAGAECTDVKGLSKFNEFRPRHIRATHKDGNLKTDAGRPPYRFSPNPIHFPNWAIHRSPRTVRKI
jgi:hypothetical protein